MPEKKRRTQLKDLPKKEEELSKEEQKKVKGGNLIIETRTKGGGTGSMGEGFDGSGKDFIER